MSGAVLSVFSILLKSSPPKMRDTTFQSTLGPAQPRPRVGATRRTYVRACAKKNSIAARARAATGSPLPALGRGSSWGRRRLNARASRAASTSARLPRTFSFLRVVRFGAFAPTAARRGRARPRVLAVRGGTLPAISAASSVRAVASAGARACARGRRPCSPAGRPRAVRSPYRPPPTPRPKSACLVRSLNLPRSSAGMLLSFRRRTHSYVRCRTWIGRRQLGHSVTRAAHCSQVIL